jgi:hypothetical protein
MDTSCTNAIYGCSDAQADVFHGHAAKAKSMNAGLGNYGTGTQDTAYGNAKVQAGILGASSACTVGDRINQCIRRAENELRSLIDLKGSLPGDFLRSPVARIAGLVGR